MKTKVIGFAAASIVASLLVGGCSTPMETPGTTGFLSDYSNLERVDGDTQRFIGSKASLRHYRSFIVEPTQIDLPRESAGARLPSEELESLATDMRRTLINRLTEGYFQITDTPAVGVARIRTSITNIKPQTPLGVGGASIEAEAVDSVTGAQIAALVESRLGQPRDGRVAMDRWAGNLQSQLTAAARPVPTSPGTGVPERVGFLTTYGNLAQRGPSSLSYLNPANRLGRYTKFIVAPVEVYFHEAETTISESNKRRLQQHMRQTFIDHLDDRYTVVTEPGYDVGLIRLALTDVRRSTPVLNVIPRPKMVDVGLGGLSLEGEVLDSVSGVQIAALVESSLGRNRRWDMTPFDDAVGVMDQLAVQFREIVDEAHQVAGHP